jgi:hypothetical protein
MHLRCTLGGFSIAAGKRLELSEFVPSSTETDSIAPTLAWDYELCVTQK